MSVSVFIDLLPYWNYTNLDNSRSGWDIFLNFFGGIPGMFVHLFQIVRNFLYVCQYVSWLTFLLKLHKYRNISSSGWYIFLKSFGDIPWMILNEFQIFSNFLYISQSVSLPTSLLKVNKYRDISCSWWDIFLKVFGEIPEMSVYIFLKFLNISCMCVSPLFGWHTYWN